MIENITVTDNNKNEIFAEGISHIQFLSSGKRNLLYTLNEQAANDRIKMYVAELSDEPGTLGKIPDEEWAKLRPELERLERGEINPDIKFLSLANNTFNIGVPKKLAITAEMKQSFKDKQAAGLLASQQQQMVDAPAVEASAGGFFNKDEVNQTPAFVSPDDTQQEQVNIFNNPMTPEIVSTQPVGGVAEQGNVQGIEQQGGVQMMEGAVVQGQPMTNDQATAANQMAAGMQTPTPVPAPTPQPQATNVSTTAEINEVNNFAASDMNGNIQPVQVANNNVDNPFIVNPMPAVNDDNAAVNVASELETASLIDNGNSIQYQEGLATSLSNDLGVATGITPKNADREVTKEEALEALEVLNRYFKNTKELPSALANELIGQDKEISVSQNEVSTQSAEDEITVLEDDISELSPSPQPEITVANDIEMLDAGINQEQGRTLSLVPEGIPSVAPIAEEANNYETAQQESQGNIYQFSEMTASNQEPQNIIPGPGFDGQMNQANQMQTGYVASSNGPAVNMSATTNNINDVPVTLPDNYNPQAMTNNNVVMGPGSLPTENYAKVA